jgi:hypothetical protein
MITFPGSRQSSPDPTPDATGYCPGWARNEQVELEGMQYYIYVAAHKGEFIGIWQCQECCEHGTSELTSESADQASIRAQIALCSHHNSTHRRPRKPR